MLMTQNFSEASNAARRFDASAKRAILTALCSGKAVQTGESLKTRDTSGYPRFSRIVARLEKFFVRCAEGHIARAARVDLWLWP